MNLIKQLNHGFFGREPLLPRLLLLTGLKESWLFLTNAYGLFFHPRRSLKKIMNDRSQLALFALAVVAYLIVVKFSFR